MSYPFSLAQDLEFALDSGEFPHLTPALRYVAALHPEASRSQFIEELAACGIHRNTAGKQFGLSRRFDSENYGVTISPDGCIIGSY